MKIVDISANMYPIWKGIYQIENQTELEVQRPVILEVRMPLEDVLAQSIQQGIWYSSYWID